MNLIKVAALAILLLGIYSCGKDKDSEINIKLETTVGDESLALATPYVINGATVQFTNVAYYLGDMTFETNAGKSFSSSDRYQLVKPGIVDYNFAITAEDRAEDERLSTISFIIGVDDVTNSGAEEDFTMRADDDPLGPQTPTMHWGWQGGYRFMNIDAEADLDGDGTFETTLTYHLGKSDFIAEIQLSPNQELEGGTETYNIKFDLVKFLEGIDFETENFTKADPDHLQLAQDLLTNYQGAFSFEN